MKREYCNRTMLPGNNCVYWYCMIIYYIREGLRPITFYLFQVFPLDYVLITVITMYFVFTSMAGIRNMGIWFFWIRVKFLHLFHIFFVVKSPHEYLIVISLSNLYLHFSKSVLKLYHIMPGQLIIMSCF